MSKERDVDCFFDRLAVEANRSTLSQSEFEIKLWREKLVELENEKRDHMDQIEAHVRNDRDQSSECTIEGLVRLQSKHLTLLFCKDREKERTDG